MAKYTVLDYAADVLETSDLPLTYTEIWLLGQSGAFRDKLTLTGKTPEATLGARLFVDVRDNQDSRFIKVGKNPARFFLKKYKERLPANITWGTEPSEPKTKEKAPSYHERDLHPLVAYFAYSNLGFNKGRSVLTKTIFHEKSKKTGLNEWIHPDMVGVYIPIDDWDKRLIDFSDVADSSAVKLYSFEIKKKLDKSNYREHFFQAVSNSSWAHESYLVAVEILDDEDLNAELERLTSTFGIGVIKLDLADIESSHVLFAAKTRKSLEWELMNKLCEQNTDFADFIENVTKDFQVKRYTKEKYDKILEDIDGYLLSKRMSHVQ